VTFMCRVATIGRGTVIIEWNNANTRSPISTPVNGPNDISTDTLTIDKASQLTPTVNCSAMIENSLSRSNFVNLTITGTQ